MSTFLNVTVGTSACNVVTVNQTIVVCIVPEGEGSSVPVIVTVASQISNIKFFSYNVPSISYIFPAKGPTLGGIPVLIAGSSFGLNPSVSIGGYSCNILNHTHSQIFCTLAAGAGVNLRVIVNCASQESTSSIFFSYDGPQV